MTIAEAAVEEEDMAVDIKLLPPKLLVVHCEKLPNEILKVSRLESGAKQ